MAEHPLELRSQLGETRQFEEGATEGRFVYPTQEGVVALENALLAIDQGNGVRQAMPKKGTQTFCGAISQTDREIGG